MNFLCGRKERLHHGKHAFYRRGKETLFCLFYFFLLTGTVRLNTPYFKHI